MENIQLLMHGFSTLFTFSILGAVLGLVVGAMPGIGSLAGVALLLPLTYKFNPTTAIIMLGALYYSNMYGGAFSAILLNIPGDSPAICTAMDGYPMASKKKRPAGPGAVYCQHGFFYRRDHRYHHPDLYRSCTGGYRP